MTQTVQQNQLSVEFKGVLDALKAKFLERDEAIDVAGLAFLVKQHVFFLGPPGTAKSAVLQSLSDSIGGAVYFRTLLGKMSTKDQLFGPISIPDLKQGVNRYNTTGHMPEAHLAFVDEIYKGNEAIVDSLLTIMNERQFQQGGVMETVPLRTLAAASNELPEDEKNVALHDRIPLRVYVDRLQDRSNRIELLSRKAKQVATPLAQFPLSKLDDAYAEIRAVEVPDEVLHIMEEVHDATLQKGIVTSDRRLEACIPIVQAHAWLDGRSVASRIDAIVLKHVYWNDPSERLVAEGIVLGLVAPLLAKAREYAAQVNEEFAVARAVAKEHEENEGVGDPVTASSEAIAKAKVILKRLGKVVEDAEGEGYDAASLEQIQGIRDRARKQFQEAYEALLNGAFEGDA